MVDHLTFEQVVAQVFQNQASKPTAVDSYVTRNDPSEPTLNNVSKEFISLNGEDIPIIHSQDLTDISLFRQLYLIGKILGESMPLKMILSKCMNLI